MAFNLLDFSDRWSCAEAYGLQGPEAYSITSRSNCLEVPGIDDVDDWHETLVRN